jgi:hypothetical protein
VNNRKFKIENKYLGKQTLKREWGAGLPDFSWSRHTKGCKLYQMAIKCNNIIYSKALQILPKLGFFGLKTHHLATLVGGGEGEAKTEGKKFCQEI